MDGFVFDIKNICQKQCSDIETYQKNKVIAKPNKDVFAKIAQESMFWKRGIPCTSNPNIYYVPKMAINSWQFDALHVPGSKHVPCQLSISKTFKSLRDFNTHTNIQEISEARDSIIKHESNLRLNANTNSSTSHTNNLHNVSHSRLTLWQSSRVMPAMAILTVW